MLRKEKAVPLFPFETGETSAYGLYNTQDRGCLFVGPGVEVYEGHDRG